jgi:hypothetical protein
MRTPALVLHLLPSLRAVDNPAHRPARRERTVSDGEALRVAVNSGSSEYRGDVNWVPSRHLSDDCPIQSARSRCVWAPPPPRHSGNLIVAAVEGRAVFR